MAQVQKHLFISPHPDDIAFSAFASLTLVPQNKQREVVTVFSQSCWTFTSEIDPKRARYVTAQRRAEDERFAWSQNALIRRLGFKDTSLRGLSEGEEYRRLPPGDPLYRSVTEALARVLEDQDGRAICYVPLGVSHHLDHLMVRDAVLSLRSGPHDVVFYEDLPYCENYSEQYIREFVRALSPELPLAPKLSDLTSHWPEKIAAVRLYESQLEAGTIESLERYAARVAGEGRLAERVWALEPSE